MNAIEQLWEAILSRDAELVATEFSKLDEIDRLTINDHLRKMATEPGWHIEQRRSAQTAIDIISKLDL